MTDEKKVLSRADFLSASANLKRELVEVPELGGAVYIRELSGKQVIEYNERIRKLQADSEQLTPSTSINLMALLVSMSACDEGGGLLFTEADVQALSENNIAVLMHLSAAAMKVSGLGDSEIEEVKAEIKKAASADLPSN